MSRARLLESGPGKYFKISEVLSGNSTLKFASVQEEVEGQIWNPVMLGWGIKQLSIKFTVKTNHFLLILSC